MVVRFRVNLGSMDAEKLQLNCRECQLGMELKVTKDTAEWLVSRGIAEPTDIDAPTAPAKVIQAVPKAAEVKAVKVKKDEE